MSTSSAAPEVVECCPPDGLRAPIERVDAEQLAPLLKAIADPTRIQLVTYIYSSANSEACVCDLTEPLGLTQPTVSHHLRVLSEVGLIKREKRGTWAWYTLNKSRWQQLSKLFEI